MLAVTPDPCCTMLICWRVGRTALDSVRFGVRLTINGANDAPLIEIALYHQLGRLPEPTQAHRFC